MARVRRSGRRGRRFESAISDKKMKRLIICLAILIHLSFYFSALKTHHLDVFFAHGNTHELQGLDFFQVPSGAYAWLRGGSLTGQLAENTDQTAYAPFSNNNVYHPFFTIVLGSILQLFPAETAFKLWLFFRLLITILLTILLYKKYRLHKNFPLAVCLLIALFPHYLEIWNGQYQFLLDLAIFIILIGSLNKHPPSKKTQLFNGILYACSLLVKPIGLLWIVPLFLKKRYLTLFSGLLIFIAVSLPFAINGDGMYYFANLFNRVNQPIGGPPGIFTLDAIFRHFVALEPYANLLKIAIAILLLIIQIRVKPNFFTSLFMWTSYYLLFYDLVFEYHYTSLAPFLALGFLSQKTFNKPLVKISSLSYLLPTPFILFYLLQIGAEGRFVTDLGWMIMVLFRVIPLIIINYELIKAEFYSNTDSNDKIADQGKICLI